jgi:predicted hydrocarbon binding protein
VRLRKDVNVYIYDPSKKHYHVMIELENVPGALVSVLEVVRKIGLNILGSSTSVDSASRVGVWSGFVEDGDHGADELKRRLSGSPYVHDVMVVESKDGFLVDGVSFPLAYNTGARAVLMNARSLSNMLRNVKAQFGSGGNVILYEEGRSYGKDVGGEYVLALGGDFLSRHTAEALKLYQALGWFRVAKVREDEDGSLTVQAEDNFECSGRDTKAPNSHFVRGHIEGVITAWTGRPMECREVRCAATGDECCEFVLTPRGA